MKIVNYTSFLFLLLALNGCITGQTLTLDSQYVEKEAKLEEQNSKGLVHFQKVKSKGGKRKVVYDKRANYKTKNWYCCNKEKMEINQDKHGAKIVFKEVLNECFIFNFPFTDIREYPILAIKAELPEENEEEVYDIAIGLVDDSHISRFYAYSVYPSHDQNERYYFFDLRDFILKNRDLNAAKINGLTFHVNTKGNDPVSGCLLITHLEFLKYEE